MYLLDNSHSEQPGHITSMQAPRPRRDRQYSRRLFMIGLVGAGFATCYSFGRFTLFLRSLPQFASHPRYVISVAWSPDGKRIAFAGGDYSYQRIEEPVVIRSVQTQEDKVAYSHFGFVHALAWSSTDKYIASASEDGRLLVWDIVKKVLFFTVAGGGYYPCLAWSPDEKYIVRCDEQHLIEIWDLLTGKKDILNYGAQSLAWSSDGKRIAAGINDSTVLIWDAPAGGNTLIYCGHDKPPVAVDWSPDSTQIVSADDYNAQVWNGSTGERLLTFKGHSARLTDVKWSPNGKFIASSSWDNTVQVWDARTGSTIFTYRGHTRGVNTIAWSPDSTLIASGSQDETMQVWRALTGELRFTDHL